MPFTPAHAAIVLPFLRSKYTSATGLIIGTVTPDFEYFFKLSAESRYGHTLLGLLYYDLPVSCFLAFIFHVIVKEKLITNLPRAFQNRLQTLRIFNFTSYFRNNYDVFLLSALLGAASHNFWDNFTHGDGFFINQLSIYDGIKVPFNNVNYPLWFALQYVSTVIGLLAVGLYLYFMKIESSTAVKPKILYWLMILVLAVLIILVRFNFKLAHAQAGNFIIACIGAACYAVVLISFVPYSRNKVYG